jgi:monofunctional biosynthetic peptidoglycan transglycosylase
VTRGSTRRRRSAPLLGPVGRARARRWLRIVLLGALLGPPALILVYRVAPPPLTPLMVQRLVQGHGLRKDWRPLARISPHLARAVIASEDNLFCRHWGFDARALREQVERALDGERARGASTITQQTAKNVLLWGGRDPLRKALEAWLAPQLELLWGKRRVLEVYLNVIETGPGLYGAEAAARAYFAKPAADLTRREAALVAAVLPNPLRWSPARPTRYIQVRARTIEARVGQLGALLDCAP